MKRLICVLLCLILLFSGCESDGDGENSGAVLSAAQGMSYKTARLELPFAASGIKQALLANGKIYIVAEKRQEKGNYFETETVLYIAGTDGRVLSPANGVPCGQSVTPEQEGMIALSLFADENGEANLLYQRFAYGEGPAKLSRAKIEDSGELSGERQFDVALTVGSNLQFARIGGDGRIYAGTEENFSIYEQSGKCVFSEDGLRVQDVFPMGTSTAVLRWTDSGKVLSTVKKNGKAVLGAVPVDGAQNIFASGGRYDIVAGSSTALFAYDAESGDSVKLFEWLDVNINYDRLCAVLMTEEGGAFCLGIDDKTGTIFADMLTPVSEAELPEKTVLTVGITSTGGFDWDKILEFNRNNEEYYLKAIFYTDEENGGVFGAGAQKLALDVTTGAAPDIYQIDDIPAETFARRGAFCDLTPLIERDLGENALYKPFADKISVDGRIYEAYSDFILVTVVGLKKTVGAAEDWSFDKLRAAYAALPPGAAAFDGGNTTEFILKELLSGGIYDFVDFEHATCDFESGEFASMLEFAASAAGNEHEGESFAAMENGELLLSTAYVYEPGMYALYRAHSTKEEVSVVGYPSKSGGTALLFAGGGFAISAASAHKEAAWEFVKQLLTEENQSKSLENPGFPTNAAAFEKYLAAEKAPPVGDGTAYHYGNGVNFDSVTEQERQELRELIDGATFYREKDYADIISIIREESAHFFAGNCSAEDCAARVQGRVGILLSEKFE